jgi:hypothetical protein
MTVAPLRIETDRYERLEVNEQLCFNCSKLGINVVEDEKHVLLQCPGYADIRQSNFSNICELNFNFINMSDDGKFLYMFHNENVCTCLCFINIYSKTVYTPLDWSK